MWPEGNKTQPQLCRTHQLLLNHGFYFSSFALLMFGFSINERNHLKWGSGEGGPLTPSSTTEIKGRPRRRYLKHSKGQCFRAFRDKPLLDQLLESLASACISMLWSLYQWRELYSSQSSYNSIARQRSGTAVIVRDRTSERTGFLIRSRMLHR